ncbi:MAG: substrate-binding domain-containing protein, partial [Gaiellaceae bacterium]
DQPRPAMGRRAMTLLVERMDGTRTTTVNVRVTPSLVIRSTTGPPPPGV